MWTSWCEACTMSAPALPLLIIHKPLWVFKPQGCATSSSLTEANLKQIWPLCEAAFSECFLILQSRTQSHRGSRGISLGLARPGHPCRSSPPHPRCAPLRQAEMVPGRDPHLGSVRPGLDGSSSGTRACPRTWSFYASALSLPCSGQSVWGMTGTKRQQASFCFEACQPSTYATDGTDRARCWEPNTDIDNPQCRSFPQKDFSIMFQKLCRIFGSLFDEGKVHQSGA